MGNPVRKFVDVLYKNFTFAPIHEQVFQQTGLPSEEGNFLPQRAQEERKSSGWGA